MDPYNKSHLESIFEFIKGKFELRANFTDLTDNTVARLQLKLYRLLQAIRKCSGSRTIKKHIDKFTKDEYNLELKYTSRKRKIEEELELAKAKQIKIENELEKVKNEAKKKIATMDKRIQIMSRKLITKSRTYLPGSKKIKNYSKSHIRRLTKQREENCKDAVAFLKTKEYTPVKLTVRNKNGDSEDISLLDTETKSKLISRKKPINEATINMCLYAKDKFNVSNEAYHEIAMINQDLPRSHVIKSKAKELNSFFDIKAIERGVQGYQQSIRGVLTFILNYYFKLMTNESFPTTIRVKLSGDGTWIGSKLHVVNFTFTLPDFPCAKSADGNVLLAIFKGSENYFYLQNALKDIIQETTEFTSLSLQEKVYQIVYYMGGDLKFLNIICGLDSCASKYSCIWCKCPSDQRYDTKKLWSMVDINKGGARTVKEIEECSKKRSKSEKYNCSNPPLFPSIPLTRVVPDTLHLFFRICDQLINQLIKDLMHEDNVAKLTKYTKIDINKHKHIAAFEQFVNERGISWRFFVDKETKLIKHRDFTGPEKYMILSAINLSTLLPNYSETKLDKIEVIWDGFRQLISKLDNLQGDDNQKLLDFSSLAKTWLKNYVSVYPTKDATPYMHILANHIPETIEINGALSQFTQQGLEKLNDHVTKWYYRSTSLSHEAAMKQIIEKQSRLLQLHFSGASRYRKFQWTCKTCHKKGHSSKTCVAI